jgi:hypothetical protein
MSELESAGKDIKNLPLEGFAGETILFRFFFWGVLIGLI